MRNVIAVVFAVLSGLSYGASDFSGALATKKNNAALVTIVVQIVSLVALGGALYLLDDGTLIAKDLAWGAVAGIGATVGLTTFYKALATGPMSTAASVTGLVGSLVPVATGLLLGEVPNDITLAGIALAIPAAIVVSVGAVGLRSIAADANPRARTLSRSRASVTRGLSVIAGFGFGLFFVALAQTSGDGGLYPLLGARSASILVLTLVLSTTRSWERVDSGAWPAIAVAGVLDCSANSLYLLALEGGSFTWVAAVVSLYPVGTVLLARLILKEHITRVQLGGLAAAAAALVLISLGAT